MSSANDLIGKRISFYQLFTDYNFTVEVPTIQRDYAQGRESKKEVRDLFLKALYDYLEENIPNRDLDFVYGSTEEVDEKKKFIPLDGQQRLTTLFLLHWYLANLSGNIEDFRKVVLDDEKSRFTYLTRPSSGEFTDALLNNEVDLKKLLLPDNKKENSLSKTIKDKGWFYLSWSFDPTIQSMLTMLDAIHSKFIDKKEYYSRLIDVNSPIITFLFLDLKKFKLTEDLYIKMNSRGKPLTSFENFKAKLEQHIEELFGIIEKPYTIPSKTDAATYREYFSFQIDTLWANLFWQYRKLVGKPNSYDEELMNFIRVIIANQFAIEKPNKLETFKELIKNESATSELTENLSFYKFQEFKALSKSCIKYLINSFDVLVNEDKRIKNHLTDTFYFNENDVFEKALKYSLSLPERAVFHSYLRGLIDNPTDKTNFYQWMRVVHNLVENSRIEDAEQLTNAIKSLESLLEHSADILTYLRSANCRIDYFSSWQIDEEILKAHLFLKSKVWQEVIEDCEKQSFHKGQIAYIFEFSGVLEYFKVNKNVDWNTGENDAFLNKFKDYTLKSVALFRIYETEENKNYVLERALLSKGNYLIPATNNRFNFCSSKKVANYQRDFSWKRLLRMSSTDENYWKTKRSIVKELVDDSVFDISNVADSLIKIRKNVPTDWRSYFIENYKLIKYCNQGYIQIANNFIELFKESQLNHYHIDMYIYNLYTKNIDKDLESYKPFEKFYVEEIKNSEDYSTIQFTDWLFKKKNYSLIIYRHEDFFDVVFEKTKGNKNFTEFHPEITEIILANKFKWDEKYNVYSINKSTELATLNFVKKLCIQFNSMTNE